MKKLQEFQFTIVHHTGKAHSNADALYQQHYRKECPNAYGNTDILAATTLTGYSTAELHQAQLEDPNIGKVLQAKQGNCRPSMEQAKSRSLEYRRPLQQWEQLSVMDGVLMRLYTQPRENQGWTQLVVPEKFRLDILKELHEGMIGGHMGQEKTVSKLKEQFYWPGHYNDVRD